MKLAEKKKNYFKDPKKNIVHIVEILTKEMEKYPTPSVTMISWQNSPYKVLISCLLSLRTRDSVTIEVAKRLFEVADTAEKMSKLSLAELELLIRKVNLYKGKAERILALNKIILEKYKSRVPETMEELLAFKGVGRKTAGITLVYGYNQKEVAIPVDIHVHRTANRIGFVKTKMPDETEYMLMRLLPKKYWGEYNNTFVGFGQNICKPINPKCGKCLITKYCKFFNEKVKKELKKDSSISKKFGF